MKTHGNIMEKREIVRSKRKRKKKTLSLKKYTFGKVLFFCFLVLLLFFYFLLKCRTICHFAASTDDL